MQISEHIENLLMNTLVLQKKTSKKHRFGKTPFYVFLLGNGLNKFWAKFGKVKYYKTLQSSYPNHLQ
jgi:hypothetical protein